jgi:hypothetical protein
MPKNTMVATQATIFDATLLADVYQIIATLPHSVSILRIVNASTDSILISYDGDNPYDCITAQGSLQIQAQTNSQPQASVANFPAGTKIYAALLTGDSGDTGAVVVTGYYQPKGA